MKPREIFLRSLTKQEVPRPAVGSATSIVTTDLMKKTGIFFPDAHLDPEKMAGLAAAGYTEIGFDNVMPLFSVWHESSALGCKVDWGNPNRMPDSHGKLFNVNDALRIRSDFLAQDGCRIPLEALTLLAKQVGDEAAIVGKVFGPWTLGYHLFGVEDFLANTLLKPDAVKMQMEILAEVTVAFANAQIEAGADAICLADHATRDLCSPESYRDFLMHMHSSLSKRISCPLILHICGDTSDRIQYIKETGIECFHFDSKVDTPTARNCAGDTLALMGGTSNLNIIRGGTPEAIVNDTAEKIANGIEIIGPECAVPLDAPWNNMKILADTVIQQSE